MVCLNMANESLTKPWPFFLILLSKKTTGGGRWFFDATTPKEGRQADSPLIDAKSTLSPGPMVEDSATRLI